MSWLRDRSLTLCLLALFGITLIFQVLAGQTELNEDLVSHGWPPLDMWSYLTSGHMWEATLENWESEFLQMGVFVVLTVSLIQKGSPESRRPGAIEESDADPRRFRDLPDVPWPVRRGGWILFVYERSLGLAFALLFLASWAGHAIGGWKEQQLSEAMLRRDMPTFWEYLSSSTFWFQSMQNWQSEFLSIAAMVWLSVYLRHRGSPESKPVHAKHTETGR